MKTPTPTFLAELRAFRYLLTQPSIHTDPDPAYEQEFERKQKVFLALIDRWIERADDKDAWETLKEKCPNLQPGLFIREILRRGDITADELSPRIADYATVEKRALTRIKKLKKEAKGAAKAEKYRAAAVELQLLADLIESRDQFSRKGETAARQHFIRKLSERFEVLTGEPLDAVTAVMVYVAFGEHISADAVRMARQSDPRVRPPK
jgi:hypothetical protein